MLIRIACIITLAVSCLLPSASSWASVELARSKNCLACHSTNKKLVGPAYVDVANRYAGVAGIENVLATKLREGSSGVWGAIPMPATRAVNADEALQLARWVLSLAGGGSGSGTDDTSQTIYTPQAGLWWNPSASGHGYDIGHSGSSLVLVWYTYDTSGAPAWYLASGPRDGNRWSATAFRYQWDDVRGGAVGTPVGTVNLTFTRATTANFSWNIGGQTGGETIEHFVFGSSVVPRSSANLTGLWYDRHQPGYGLTIVTQGTTEVAVLYFYDSAGNPRWVLGSATHPITAGIEMMSYLGSCPNCTYVKPGATPAGNLSHSIDPSSMGSFSSTIRLQSPLAGEWNRSTPNFGLLTEPQEQCVVGGLVRCR